MSKIKNSLSVAVYLTSCMALPIYSQDIKQAYIDFSQESQKTIEEIRSNIFSLEETLLYRLKE